ncbi:hypothetical protein GCM10007860_12980 [Chitiniphilus shinanonensis]|uniref:GxxExxY protein n=1 Tax=Chitiniphilus shinanonensis TaxID=553088 RepID=A0ABQ6BRS8_9NEIS|nr:GxxExxY protein [Chitiniphilus shinanonensis]GLS04152.1 hypothetical protein GCM10007860_12980 [Chitiniphilus shinanonensis]
MLNDPLSEQIIGAAIEVHRALGAGLLENAYEQCLRHELALRGLAVQSQLHLPIRYKGVQVDHAFKLDLLVEERVIVELKSCEKLLPIHESQLLTYLKLTGLKTGLLINFNTTLLKNGLRRLVL